MLLFNLLEAVFLKLVVDATLFHSMQDVQQLTQGKIALHLHCVLVDQVKPERVNQLFSQIQPKGIF